MTDDFSLEDFDPSLGSFFASLEGPSSVLFFTAPTLLSAAALLTLFFRSKIADNEESSTIGRRPDVLELLAAIAPGEVAVHDTTGLTTDRGEPHTLEVRDPPDSEKRT